MPAEEVIAGLHSGQVVFVAGDIYTNGGPGDAASEAGDGGLTPAAEAASPGVTAGSSSSVKRSVSSTASRASSATRSLDGAAALFAEARVALEAGDVSRTLQLAADTLRTDPDHPEARRLLGYQRIGDTWGGGYAVRMVEGGRVWHPKYGWIRPKNLDHWNAGERPLGRRWVSAEEDARQHATLKDGWQVRTDHFQIITNSSREAAVELAVRLETLYQVWQQLFGEFFLTQKELVDRLDGRQPAGYRRKPFQVRYHRSRDQYNASLKRHQPRIDITLGIYFDHMRESHFFAGPDQDAGTLQHEAVHQLFQESVRSTRDVGELGNVWAVEGVACYFESLVPLGSTDGGKLFAIGLPNGGRLPAAHHRRLVDDVYIPLREFSAIRASELRQREDIARLYTQSAGLATFLMHDQQGRYRRPLAAYLQAIYAGRDQPNSLPKLTGQGFEQLDEEYREFLESLP